MGRYPLSFVKWLLRTGQPNDDSDQNISGLLEEDTELRAEYKLHGDQFTTFLFNVINKAEIDSQIKKLLLF